MTTGAFGNLFNKCHGSSYKGRAEECAKEGNKFGPSKTSGECVCHREWDEPIIKLLSKKSKSKKKKSRKSQPKKKRH
jgi:hypothetical protein